LGQTKSFLGGGKSAPRGVDLLRLRLQPGEGFHDLPDDFVMKFLGADPGCIQAGLSRSLPAKIEKPARSDAPAKGGSADRRNQRTATRFAATVFKLME
jgi:hypothetical protein